MNCTSEHKAIMTQFRIHDGELLSSDLLQQLTNIEPVKISVILADLVAHGILHKVESGETEGWWHYQLSDYGRKYVNEQS
jgi:DNA-binding HxlR family transcriptional regulator